MKNILKAILIGAIGLTVCGFDDQAGCNEVAPKADQQQRRMQEQMVENANQQTGMPGISNFQEKKIMKRLYEMRDHTIATHTYIADMNGRLFHLCDSMGFGLPYATQYSNPERPLTNSETQMEGNAVISQPEPNGLFMPSSAEGTWIICASEKGEFDPIYVEPRVIVSTHKLKSDGEYTIK